MANKAKNMLFIFSDEHTREITGCYGNSLVQTPNIDRLAATGTCFDNAYTNSPICVPARASLATGRYVHQVGYWDNAHAYDGVQPGWGQRLINAGHRVTAIGKLHYRSQQDPTGWDEEIETLHIVDALGDLFGCNRHQLVERPAVRNLAAEAGPGDSTYIRYDQRIAEQTCRWLREQASQYRDQAWVLFVGFVLPHFPLIAPPEYYALYAPEDLPWPRLYDEHERARHPVLDELRRSMNYDAYFDAERVRVARAAYYAMVTLLDHNIGLVLTALQEAGLADETRIIYTSDHGDNLGHRGLWGKSVMYEEAAAIPMIISAADVPAGGRVDAATSLVDCYPSIVEGVGLELDDYERQLPGHSLIRLANGATPERTVLSEYHAAGSIAAMYMIRNQQYKYVHYAGGYPAQLFDLQNDPHEREDLAADANYRAVLAECEQQLRALLDPEAVNRQAFADQDAKIAANGGWDVVKQRGDFGYTPAPGQVPIFEG